MALFIAALVFHVAPAISAEGVTWRRAYIRNWENAAMERALGAAAVARSRVEASIVGGILAPPGRWPFQVALLDASVPSNYNAQFCGGSLVGTLFVVTAAHCVYGMRAAEIHVLTGTQSLATGGTRRAVAAIKIHPSYNNNTTDFDIAVIKLKTAATVAAYAKLLSAQQENRFAPTGMSATAAGWGNTKSSGASYPKDLRQVTVPLVSRTDCNDANSYDGAITARMICAGFTNGGKDSCDGDSGGPLVVKDAAGKWTLQAGIVSWGDGCAAKNLFGVYSRVAALSSWANNIIAGLSPAQTSADCETLSGQGQSACIDGAIAANEREMRGYLDVLRGDADAQAFAAAEAGQQSWSVSLAGLCAFARATAGEAGGRLCLLKEMEKRAATLAEHLSADGR